MMGRMGMYGTFQRVTPAELARAIADPRATFKAFDPRAEGEAADRLFHLDKAWHGVQYLLDSAGVDLDAVFYANVFDGFGDDLPMGSYLRPGEVAAAAEVLSAVPPEALAAQYDADALQEADVYPGIWAREGDAGCAWLTSHYEGLDQYLSAAAKDGDAVLFWVW